MLGRILGRAAWLARPLARQPTIRAQVPSPFVEGGTDAFALIPRVTGPVLWPLGGVVLAGPFFAGTGAGAAPEVDFPFPFPPFFPLPFGLGAPVFCDRSSP